MSDIVERLAEPEAHYPGNFDTPKRANAMLSCLCQEAKDEIETLRQQLAEKDEEIGRLKHENDLAFGSERYAKKQLAASQAREQQLRDALESVIDQCECDINPGRNDAYDALDLPQDTSALESMIDKAGEVMRERCLNRPHPPYADYLADGFIRTLSGVTLEDLQK